MIQVNDLVCVATDKGPSTVYKVLSRQSADKVTLLLMRPDFRTPDVTIYPDIETSILRVYRKGFRRNLPTWF